MSGPNEQPKPSAETDDTAPYAGFEGRVGRTFAGSEGWWPARADGAGGRPEHHRDDRRRPRLQRYRLLRLGDRHAEPGLALPLPACSSPTSTRHRCAHLPGPPCSRARTRTRPAWAACPTAIRASRAMRWSWPRTRPPSPRRSVTTGGRPWRSASGTSPRTPSRTPPGNKRSWPCQRGFERYYGVLDAFTNLHHPHRIVEDNHQVEVDQYPDDYFFTDDITDHAIAMIRETKAADPSKPFFLYFAHAAVHAPLHAKADDIAKYRGRYDAGWDAIRAERFARQKALGVMEPRHRAGAAELRARTTTCGRGPSCRPRSRSCSPGTWRSSRARSTTSTRTSAGS